MGMTAARRQAYQRICEGPGGRILVVAMDHRATMAPLIQAAAGKPTNDDLVNAKLDLVATLGVRAPCVLLDPTTAVPQVVMDHILPPSCSLMIGMDASGYDTDAAGLRVSRMVEGVDARRVRYLGGAAAKLNVYMRPDREGLDSQPARLIAATVEDCAREDLLLVVEIRVYALLGEGEADFNARVPDLIARAAWIARECGAEVVKLQFPGSRDACATVTDTLGEIPWAVLSGGVDHATFLDHLRIALEGGAAGAITGRSVWKDCLRGDREATVQALSERAVPRIDEIRAVLAGMSA